jgi:hypothetical protein
MLKNPGVAHGVISGFPVHDSYSLEDREKLDKLFREDYFACLIWKRQISDAEKLVVLFMREISLIVCFTLLSTRTIAEYESKKMLSIRRRAFFLSSRTAFSISSLQISIAS